MDALKEYIKKTESHPSRGAWIEILYMWPCHNIQSGRTPRGVRGLKYLLQLGLLLL